MRSSSNGFPTPRRCWQVLASLSPYPSSSSPILPLCSTRGMSGYVDPEALLPKDESTSASLQKPATVWGWIANRGSLLRFPNFFRFNRARLFKRLLMVALIVSGTVLLLWVGRIARRWVRDTMGPMEDLDLNTPPRYLDLKEIQKNLPQHNLSLPFPEGSTGRYVKFSSQRTRVGWNNVLHEVYVPLKHPCFAVRKLDSIG